MSEPGLQEWLFLIFFIYGLSFLTLGLAMVLETMRSPSLAEACLLRPLAVFGILHGVHEWLEFFILQATWVGAIISEQVAWFRLGLLSVSFIALLLYGNQAFHLYRGKISLQVYTYVALLTAYMVAIATSTVLTYAGMKDIPWFRLSDALIRYLLAVPGATLAALGLRSQVLQIHEDSRKPLAVNLNWAALALGLYGISQIFVPTLDMFPANFINADSFLRATGIPHQVVRSILAVVITSSLIRATHIVERERQEQVLVAQQARLDVLEQMRVELQEREEMRRELLRHTVRAQEDERARIAREIHDETAQVLSAFSLDLATLRNLLHRRPEIIKVVERLQNLSRQMSQGLYHLVHDLRPAHLDDLGLIPALQYILEKDCNPKGLSVAIGIDGTQRRLDPLIETALFRVAQESLTNVVRHAATKEAKVHLHYETNQVTLKVSDAGKGFDPKENFSPPRGWGMAGMRERVESMAGQFNLQSAPGYGTTVKVIIPLSENIPQE